MVVMMEVVVLALVEAAAMAQAAQVEEVGGADGDGLDGVPSRVIW